MIETYLDEEGRVTTWPSRKRRLVQIAILEYLASKFETDRFYKEKEVNEIIRQWHLFDDHALLRRELFESKLLTRELDGTNYRFISMEA
jgi:chloramphenicol O-acetyltransferase type A